MSNLLEELTKQFGGQMAATLGQKAGVNGAQAGSILESAMPILVNALARNASSNDGAQSLQNALNKDHDGSILDNLSGFLGNSQSGPGAGILKHILGGKRGAIEGMIGKKSGVSSNAVGSILEMAAPILMGMLGKQQRSQGLSVEGLSGLLKNGASQMAPQTEEGRGMLHKLLDQDGDGDISDDVFNLLGKFMRK